MQMGYQVVQVLALAYTLNYLPCKFGWININGAILSIKAASYQKKSGNETLNAFTTISLKKSRSLNRSRHAIDRFHYKGLGQ